MGKDAKQKDAKQSLKDMLKADQIAVTEHLQSALDTLDYWEGLLMIETLKGIKFQVQIRDVNHQRGGGGKRTQYEYEGTTFESGVALCDHLKLVHEGDSAPRVIKRYMAANPAVKITVIK